MTTKGQPSLRSLARGFGCSLSAIQKAFKAGRLTGALGLDEKGRLVVLDAELAAKLWAQNRVQLSQAKGQPPQEPLDSADETRESERDPDDDRPEGGWDLVSASIRVKLADARGKEQALRVREGELVEKALADRQAFAAARVIRDSLLNVADRVAAELAGETDPAVVHARLDSEIRQALQVAAEGFKGAVRR